LNEIRGGDAEHNALILSRVFGRDGQPHEHGPYRDIVLVNSAAALLAAGRVPDFLAGMRLAAGSIDSGAARARLDALVAFTQGAGGHGQCVS
jgi:anthranilate phosphoribosyltransferase